MWVSPSDPWGRSYRIRSGLFLGAGQRHYFVAVGRSLALNDAIVGQVHLGVLLRSPFIVLIGGLLGWFLTQQACNR